jgi:hypothetical protein
MGVGVWDTGLDEEEEEAEGKTVAGLKRDGADGWPLEGGLADDDEMEEEVDEMLDVDERGFVEREEEEGAGFSRASDERELLASLESKDTVQPQLP